MTKLKKQPPVLEVKYEELDQYDYFDEEVMMEKEEKYAYIIGKFIIWFSALENALNEAMLGLINSNTHFLGYVVTKDMDLSEKIQIFYDLSISMIFFSRKSSKKKEAKTEQLNKIKKELENLCTLRNKIAHAKWYSLDKDGYVRCDVRTDKGNGMVKFRKFKITPAVISSGVRKASALEEKLPTFADELLNFD